jgi:hypothetical protein
MPKTNIKVKLVGEDGNAFAIMARVKIALERGGRGDLVKDYLKDSTSGDYDHLLQVAMEYCECDTDEPDDGSDNLASAFGCRCESNEEELDEEECRDCGKELCHCICDYEESHGSDDDYGVCEDVGSEYCETCDERNNCQTLKDSGA